MGRKSKFTSKQKIEACEKYIKGQGSLCSISDELGITCQSFRRWLLTYKNNGKDCFEESNTNKSYSSDFKIKIGSMLWFFTAASGRSFLYCIIL